MTHTPIPKLFTEKIATDDWTIYFTDSDGDIHILATNLTEEGAQFIVTACNEYEALKEQNEELVELVRLAHSIVDDTHPVALNRFSAALAKAGK